MLSYLLMVLTTILLLAIPAPVASFIPHHHKAGVQQTSHTPRCFAPRTPTRAPLDRVRLIVDDFESCRTQHTQLYGLFDGFGDALKGAFGGAFDNAEYAAPPEGVKGEVMS